MATPEIEPGWLSAAWTWIAGIGATLFAGWKFIDGKLTALTTKVEEKADKTDAENDIKAALGRIEKSNEHIEKLYQNAEKDRAFTRDLHDKAMGAINANQTQIISGQQMIMGVLRSGKK